MADEDLDAAEEQEEEPVDLGEPIVELRELRESTSPGFFDRILESLRRRSLSAQLMTLSWTGMSQVVLEYMKIIHSLFQSGRSDGVEE